MGAAPAAQLRLVLTLLSWAGGTIAAAGCSRPYVMTERGPQAYYQTGYPVQDVSRDIERIARSVKQTQILVSYDVFRFAREDAITENDVRVRTTYAKATEKYAIDHSVRGTATIYSRRGNRIELITNEHVTRVPDTIIVNYEESPGEQPATARSPKYVESVAIKTRQMNLVNELVGISLFSVIARDSALDIALIAVDLDGEPHSAIELLNVTAGDPSKLGWGSFVYVLGYPQGFKMVTRGIVSDPNRDRDHSFLIDGLWNRGISGGLILAVRGDTGELEWVGMARAASAHPELMLSPERRRLAEQGVSLPYEGRFYVEQVSRIDYGITFSVSMTAIQRFLRTSAVRYGPVR
jgi:S1-C subfamily serine protease